MPKQLKRLNPALNSAQKYAKLGYRVLPMHRATDGKCSCHRDNCRSPGKHPMTPHGHKDATSDLSSISKIWSTSPDTNVGIATGSGLVVLDIDPRNDGFDSLEILQKEYGELPDTPTVNTGGGGLHFYFRTDKPIKSTTGTLGPGIDICSRGKIVVAPPSTHPSGKKYAFQEGKALGEIDLAPLPDRLLRLLLEKKQLFPSPATSQAGSSIAEGDRNNTLTSLAGGMRYRGIGEESIFSALMLENRSRCTPLLPESEVRGIAHSIAKYEPENTSNHPSIYSLIDDMNEKHAAIMIGGSFRIQNEERDPLSGAQSLTYSSEADFKRRYKNQKVSVDGKTTDLGTAWLDHPNRRQYDGICFSPDNPPDNYYNLWRGFSVSPNAGDCSLFLEHIKQNIASGEEDTANYVIAWMADAIQNPTDRPGTAIALRGKQGTGKGVFCDQFGRLFGQHYIQLSHSRHLTGNFNAHLQDKLIVFADEAFWAGDKQAEGVIKALITEDKTVIESKGKDAIVIDNHVRLLLASNSQWIVPAGFDERRFLVLDVGDRNAQDHKFFSRLADQMDNGGREALLYYLKYYDLSKVKLRKVPQTKALLDQKLRSLSPFNRFLHTVLDRGHICAETTKWSSTVHCKHLHDACTEFSDSVGQQRRLSETEIGTELKKLIPTLGKQRPTDAETGRRYYTYTLPSLKKCRRDFEAHLGTPIDWSTPAAKSKRLRLPAKNRGRG
jgi:hypothetical protein